jgi:hypothetical protein
LSGVRRWWLILVAVAFVVLFIKELPDFRRYLKIEMM